jgi:hypothetical protein
MKSSLRRAELARAKVQHAIWTKDHGALVERLAMQHAIVQRHRQFRV